VNRTEVQFVRLVAGVIVAAAMLPGCDKSKSEDMGQYLLTLHPIEAGRAYRSGQMSPEGLAWTIDHHGIKTVLNLRGHNPDKKWYQDEVKTCRDKGVILVDVSMSSQSLPPPEQLKQVVNTLRTATGPILIHCESGADRTGAVAALYRLDVLKQDRAAALKELNPDYGHFRAQKPCMDTLIEMYEPTPEWMVTYDRDYKGTTCR
jgi:protein tyrosine/serine phosphatase